MVNLRDHANFVAIGQTAAEIWRFFYFFGRPFVKRFAQCYPTVVCLYLLSVCLSCL